jgi:hypothetical protein
MIDEGYGMTLFEREEALLHCGGCHARFSMKEGCTKLRPDICVECFVAHYTYGIQKTQMFPIPFGEW